MTPAVFLDRDGTLIEDRGHLADPAQVVFYPDTIGALRKLDGFALFIVTNQNGVAKGEITLEQAARVNGHVTAHLSAAGISIREVYTCPHQRSDGCACIKPNAFFLKQAEREHGVDLARSWVVGDHPADVELAVRAGARGIYLLTGHGARHRGDVTVPCEVAEGIAAAVKWIVRADARLHRSDSVDEAGG